MRPRLQPPGRREFLRAMAGTAVLALPRVTFARGAAEAGFSVSILGERLRLIAGAGNNVVAFGGPKGTLLVDAGDGTRTSEILQGAGTTAPPGKPKDSSPSSHT